MAVTVKAINGHALSTPADAMIGTTNQGESPGRVIRVRRAPEQTAPFANVFLVVDDPHRSVSDIVQIGLAAADQARLVNITVPPLRLERVQNVVDKGVHEAVRQLVVGIDEFIRYHPDTTITSITIVVNNNPELLELFNKWLAPAATS